MEQQLQQERIVIENDDEIEIDLKDLVLEVLSFWKWVLFALIVCSTIILFSSQKRWVYYSDGGGK